MVFFAMTNNLKPGHGYQGNKRYGYSYQSVDDIETLLHNYYNFKAL